MSGRFKISQTGINELVVLERLPIGDHRGWLERLFCLQDLAAVVGERNIVQINRTMTKQRGTVRGMHFQNAPHAEMKIVSCLRGEVLDVAVDLRAESPTRYQWHGEILRGNNHKMLAIPEGFAHGFQTLTDDVEMLYLHTQSYHPASESGLNPRDPRLAIEWPLPISEISEKDNSHPFLELS
jgi:dTDP-4-dehydrorhamnose 3,5-epimerase